MDQRLLAQHSAPPGGGPDLLWIFSVAGLRFLYAYTNKLHVRYKIAPAKARFEEEFCLQSGLRCEATRPQFRYRTEIDGEHDADCVWSDFRPLPLLPR